MALLLYGFPPGVGATGTAALLNVPKSLERVLEQLQEQGYDLGEAVAGGAKIDGKAIVNALRLQEDQRAIFKGAAGIEQAWVSPALIVRRRNRMHGLAPTAGADVSSLFSRRRGSVSGSRCLTSCIVGWGVVWR